MYLNGKSYKAIIRNVNFNAKFNRKKEIRYPKNGELAKALQACFFRSYEYIKVIKENRDPSIRTMIKVPEEYREYLAIYTTEYDDSYVLETIVANEIDLLRKTVNGQQERVLETEFNYDETDTGAHLEATVRLVKIRKLNQKIGDNLKLL